MGRRYRVGMYISLEVEVPCAGDDGQTAAYIAERCTGWPRHSHQLGEPQTLTSEINGRPVAATITRLTTLSSDEIRAEP